MGVLNIISLASLFLFLLYTKYLVNLPEKKRETYLIVQLSLVLAYNIAIHIIQWGKLPVEFSTISYFIVPFVVFLRLNKLELYAVYVSLMSGVFYYISMILYGNGLYGNFPLYSWTTSIFNHGALLSYGLTILYTKNFDEKHKYIVWIGLLFNIVWSLSLRPIVNHNGRIFIYMILDADMVEMLFKSSSALLYTIYYILLALFLYSTVQLIVNVNNKLQRKRA